MVQDYYILLASVPIALASFFSVIMCVTGTALSLSCSACFYAYVPVSSDFMLLLVYPIRNRFTVVDNSLVVLLAENIVAISLSSGQELWSVSHSIPS